MVALISSTYLSESYTWKWALNILGSLQGNSTQTIDHIQKCFRQKFQCSRMPSYSTTLFFWLWWCWRYVKVNTTFLNGTMYFFRCNYYWFQEEFSHLQHKVILVTPSMKIVEKSFSFLTISMIIHIDKVLLTSAERKYFLLTYQLVTHYLLM